MSSAAAPVSRAMGQPTRATQPSLKELLAKYGLEYQSPAPRLALRRNVDKLRQAAMKVRSLDSVLADKLALGTLISSVDVLFPRRGPGRGGESRLIRNRQKQAEGRERSKPVLDAYFELVSRQLAGRGSRKSRPGALLNKTSVIGPIARRLGMEDSQVRGILNRALDRALKSSPLAQALSSPDTKRK